MRVREGVSLVDHEKRVNELLDFGVTYFSWHGVVRGRHYAVEQWVSPHDVLTNIYIYYGGEKPDGRGWVDILITIKRRVLGQDLPEKHSMEVYWRYPNSMHRSRELTHEEYGKLMESIVNLLKALHDGGDG